MICFCRFRMICVIDASAAVEIAMKTGAVSSDFETAPVVLAGVRDCHISRRFINRSLKPPKPLNRKMKIPAAAAMIANIHH